MLHNVEDKYYCNDINNSVVLLKNIIKISCNSDCNLFPVAPYYIELVDSQFVSCKLFYTIKALRDTDFIQLKNLTKHKRTKKEKKMKIPFKPDIPNKVIIDLSKIKNIRKYKDNYCNNYIIADDYELEYNTTEKRDNDYDKMLNLIYKEQKQLTKKKEKGINMIESVKKFYKEHENILFPLFLLVGLDYLFNDGRFQGKISQAIENIIDGISKKSE